MKTAALMFSLIFAAHAQTPPVAQYSTFSHCMNSPQYAGLTTVPVHDCVVFVYVQPIANYLSASVTVTIPFTDGKPPLVQGGLRVSLNNGNSDKGLPRWGSLAITLPESSAIDSSKITATIFLEIAATTGAPVVSAK